MPSPTLALSVTDLRGEIGHFLGYGRGPAFDEPGWTTQQSNNITAVMKTALSQVYTPPPLSSGEPPHEWTFLRPFADITVPSGESSALLPETFAGFASPLYVTSPQGRAMTEIRLTHEAAVVGLHADQPSTTGPPRVACERTRPGVTSDGSTRSELYVWPVADTSYTVRAAYKHVPGALSGNFPYPPGGAEHAELFKASALAAAELQLDDAIGPRHSFFMQRLMASVSADRRRRGALVGYNGDDSDARGTVGDRRHVGLPPPITYNGQSFG